MSTSLRPGLAHSEFRADGARCADAPTEQGVRCREAGGAPDRRVAGTSTVPHQHTRRQESVREVGGGWEAVGLRHSEAI